MMWKGRGAIGAKTFRSVTAGGGKSALRFATATPRIQTPASTQPDVYLVSDGIIRRCSGLYCCLIFGLT
jgi:hypothetical protein